MKYEGSDTSNIDSTDVAQTLEAIVILFKDAIKDYADHHSVTLKYSVFANDEIRANRYALDLAYVRLKDIISSCPKGETLKIGRKLVHELTKPDIEIKASIKGPNFSKAIQFLDACESFFETKLINKFTNIDSIKNKEIGEYLIDESRTTSNYRQVFTDYRKIHRDAIKQLFQNHKYITKWPKCRTYGSFRSL